jgi:hypothetical protein
VFIFDDPLKTPDGSSTVGDINVTCTAAFQESVCTGTLQLDGRGKISIVGTAPNHPGPFLLPVVGGTSEFIQASGELLVQPQGHGLETLKLFLR